MSLTIIHGRILYRSKRILQEARTAIEHCMCRVQVSPTKVHERLRVRTLFSSGSHHSIQKGMSSVPGYQQYGQASKDALKPDQRENAIKSLVYEADCRLSEPIHGVAGLVSLRHKQLKEIYLAVVGAKKELATYIGPHAAFSPFSDKQPIGKKRDPRQNQKLQQ
ncbi:hypothetical protein BUALT_Bualt16G0034000 [Buddleja alternifolia]|uniref:LOB domain-containing protein n=1 Tax=Buddleja alternifolia TaxID=168488 RepID=A0AAV6WI17_9LAMI|nr:hypothetical protein BUALT_Bualt16G0034000 [Buddleja alternifolia]